MKVTLPKAAVDEDKGKICEFKLLTLNYFFLKFKSKQAKNFVAEPLSILREGC